MSINERNSKKSYRGKGRRQGSQGCLSAKELGTFTNASAQSSSKIDPYSCEPQSFTLSQLLNDTDPDAMRKIEKKYAKLNRKEMFKKKAMEAKKKINARKASILEVCKHYKNKRCTKNPCPYMHEEYPCKHFHIYNKCAYGEECLFTHDGLTENGHLALQKIKEEPQEEVVTNSIESREIQKEVDNDAVDINSFYGGTNVISNIQSKKETSDAKTDIISTKELIKEKSNPELTLCSHKRVVEKRKSTAAYLNYANNKLEERKDEHQEKKPKLSSLDDVLQQTLGQISKKW